jgi:hypothetical protein
LGLQREGGLAIVPAPLTTNETDRPDRPQQEPLPVIVLMQWWSRTILLVLAALVVGVFALALVINPYHPDGTAKREETHRQLGLPPCTFKYTTGLPCPSCGMTTAFALLIRGDVWNSLRANAAGTLLGVVCLAFVPWAMVSAWRAQMLGIRSAEETLGRIVIVFLVVMLVRWGIVLLVYYT